MDNRNDIDNPHVQPPPYPDTRNLPPLDPRLLWLLDQVRRAFVQVANAVAKIIASEANRG